MPDEPADPTGGGRREWLVDLAFLVGVLVKGIDGLLELVGGAALLVLSPGQLLAVARAVTAEELQEDPTDLVAHLLLHGVGNLDQRTTTFVAAYLLVHGLVKVAVVVALLVGTRRIYPWAIVALLGFLVFQLYELVVRPAPTIALLTLLDAAIIWLTWREWRRGRTLRETARSTVDRILRRHGSAR